MQLLTNFQLIWFSSAPDKQSKWWMLSLYGTIALLIYALCKAFAPPLAKVAEPIMLLCGFVLFFRNVSLRQSIWVKLLIACLIIQLISWSSAMLTHAEWSSSVPTLDRLGKLFFFMPIAVLMAGKRQNVLFVWFLFGLGLILAVLTNAGGVSQWQLALSGGRADFGMQNAQHTAMYFGVLLLMLIPMVKSWLYPFGSIVIWRTVIWVFAVIFSVIMLYVTQTRAVLIGLILAFTAMSLTLFILKLKQGLSLKRKILAFASILAISFILIIGFGQTITKRMQPEQQTTQLIMQGKLQAVPFSSIGIRIQTWLVAIERIKERPIIGWGDRARSVVIQQSSTLPQDIKQQFGHLHNYFIEMQLSYGLFGSLFFVIFLISLIVVVYNAWSDKQISNDSALFGLGFFVYWLFVNNFESYFSFSSGIFVFGLIVGGLLTQAWSPYIREKTHH